MSDDFPYKCEYAKSGRSSCKGCKERIDQGTLRLAIMVQSSAFDGKVPYWFHTKCFFKKHKPKALGDIAKYDGLRYEDQQIIKGQLGMSNGETPPPAKGKGKGKKDEKKATKRPKAATSEGGPKASDFKIEYAASSRAVCIGCEQKILKEEIRCAKMDYESEKAVRFGGIPRWYHIDCFHQCRPDTEFWDSGDVLPGYKMLKEEDRKIVKEKLPKTTPIKKEEAENGNGSEPSPSKKGKFDEEAYRKQCKGLFKLRDNLETLSKTDLAKLLTYNKQQVPQGKDRILELLTDTMTFGALELCPDCKKGNMYYRNSSYHCEASDEWAKCGYTTTDPPRKVFKLPSKMKELDFLSKYKNKVGKRLFEVLERSTQSCNDVPATIKSSIKVNRPKPPLAHMNFAVQGSLSKPLDQIKKIIASLGGKVVPKIDKHTIAVISDKKTLDKGTAQKIQDAEEYGIQVIPVGFLDAVTAGGEAKPITLISKLAISAWGTDPADRLKEVEEMDNLKSAANKSKSASSGYLKSDGESKVKVQLKNGAYVDPESGLDKKAHVYKDGKDLYTAVLSRADVQQGTNSYYKIQVLQADKSEKCWVFRAWGRIGTTIGKTKLEQFDFVDEAINNFCEVFENQTAQSWYSRKHFKKQPGKYFLMDIDYGGSETQKMVQLEKSGLKSELPSPVQDLVKMIFDVKAMEETMLEFELDLQKMPLGKLSQKQIKDAFTELSNLQNVVHAEKIPNKGQIVSFSNRFYTLIPHTAGMEKLPLLDNEEIIKNKLDMLESLMELEVAYSMMKVEDGASKKVHPVDQQYTKLKTTISILERESEEFGHLLAYVKNTHAETHANYELDILEVFKVERQGEKTRYRPFRNLPNRKLLWHGSRTTNYAGILSQGLRIAPPEAPVTGYMFGKGIYFADMVSKSANYCYTSKKNNTGLLLLCEVALGEMVEHTQATFVEKLPKGKHSVKGVGRTQPNPEESVKLSHGVEIPLGKPKPQEINNTSLLYNEYIVYDQSQVKIEYLLKLNFKYKY